MKHIITIWVLVFIHSTLIGQKTEIHTAEFAVAGLCGMCKDRIEETAKKAGATVAEWNSETTVLYIEFPGKKIPLEDIRYAIAQAGHDNGAFLAPADVYNNLPLCCQHRVADEDGTVAEKEPQIEDDIALTKASFITLGLCGNCKKRIEAAAIEGGAETAEWNSGTGLTQVSYDKKHVQLEDIQKAIAAIGHDSGDFLASDDVYKALPSCCQYRLDPVEQEEHKTEDGKAVFHVSGLCGMCGSRIEETAKKAGATAASWDGETGLLNLDYNPETTNLENIQKAIAKAGHDNGDFKAADDVYSNLPGCCQYRMDATDQENLEHSYSLKGNVEGTNTDGKLIPLIGATLTWVDNGVGAITDMDGNFELNRSESNTLLAVSYIGYQTDTINVSLGKNQDIEITLSDGVFLDAVEVVYRKKTSSLSFINPINVESIGKGELRKAACCNLSESFETNPSIDVSFTDAITGTRQIQMLGLSGPYMQITRELIPDVRATAAIYGLNFTPGPWIESIQLNKGVGSVVNGFESITGQINVENKKAESGEQIHLNGFLNEGGRAELNANARKEFNKNISTAILLHGKRLSHGHDRNDDGFTDMPLEDDFVIMNRWKWYAANGWEGQIGAKASVLNHKGGIAQHFDGTSPDHENHWRYALKTNRYEAWWKSGLVFPSRPNASLGFQLSGTYHDQDAEFGFRDFDVKQKSVYANLIYQGIIGNPDHQFKTGVSYQYDDLEERLFNGFFTRQESVPGTYFEYSFTNEGKFAMLGGIRADHHNNYGLFLSPRLHARYNFAELSILKLTAGRGLRTSGIFAENLGIFSSARNIIVHKENENNPYGLDAEVAWNYGINFIQAFIVDERELTFSLDVYRTDFQNQIVVDWDRTARAVHFSNLEGKSYANSFQIKMDYEAFSNFDIRLAYRLFDVKTDYATGLLSKPLLSRHRAFVNLAYEIEENWLFDFTLNWQGAKRLPYTGDNPEEFQRPEYSPSFIMGNAQITKVFGEFEVYIGGENLFNYKQDNPIIASDAPFSKHFDASIVWAPLFGRNTYIGFRHTIGKEE